MKNQKKYKAFSLIELVIAIVVIGIIVTTIPLFLQTIISSSKVSNKDEVFFNQFSLLSLINTKYFDENNTINDNFYKDLNATNGDNELVIIENNRIGKKQINNNILRSGNKYSVSIIGPDTNESNISEYDDIDDFNGYTYHIKFGVQSGGYGINVSVFYINDETNYSSNNINFTFSHTNDKNFTNIKVIKLTTILKDGSKISLFYPNCNIGASKLLSLEEIER